MPSLPIVYLLIPFGLIFLLATLFFAFNVFHIRRYAIRSQATTGLLMIYFISFAIIVLLIGGYLLTVDWSQKFQARDLLPDLEAGNRL